MEGAPGRSGARLPAPAMAERLRGCRQAFAREAMLRRNLRIRAPLDPARPRKGRPPLLQVGDGFRKGAFRARGAPETNRPINSVAPERPRIRGTARRAPVILDLLEFCAGCGQAGRRGFPRAFRSLSSRLGTQGDGQAADRSPRIAAMRRKAAGSVRAAQDVGAATQQADACGEVVGRSGDPWPEIPSDPGR